MGFCVAARAATLPPANAMVARAPAAERKKSLRFIMTGSPLSNYRYSPSMAAQSRTLTHKYLHPKLSRCIQGWLYSLLVHVVSYNRDGKHVSQGGFEFSIQPAHGQLHRSTSSVRKIWFARGKWRTDRLA